MTVGSDIPGLTRRVRREIYDHVFANLNGEVGGVLVGTLGEHGDPPVVTGSIAALEAEGARASVTFTHDAWARVHESLDRDHPDKHIIGWYHSHPGFGIFLSNDDLFIHRNFFSGPEQIALVIDPHAGTEGVFGWRGEEIVEIVNRPTDRRGTGRPAPPGAAPPPTTGPVPWLQDSRLLASSAGMLVLGLLVGALAFGGGSGSSGQAPVTKTVVARRAHRTTTPAKTHKSRPSVTRTGAATSGPSGAQGNSSSP